MTRLSFPRRVRPALLLVIGFLALVAPAMAQSGEFVTAAKHFSRQFRSKDHQRRLDAIAEFRKIREWSALGTWLDALYKTGRAREALDVELAKIEDEIEEELRKRVEEPRMDAGDRNKMRQLVEKQIAPQRERVKELKAEIPQEETIAEKLREALGEVFASFAGEERDRGAKWLADELLRRRRSPEDQVEILRAMGRADHGLILASLLDTLHDSPIPSLRVAALNSLVRLDPDEAEKAGLYALGDDYWQVRVAGLEVLREVGSRNAIPPLIEQLDRQDGRVLNDVIKTLEHLTKASFNDNVALWRRWWSEHGASYAGRGIDGRASDYEPKTTAAAARGSDGTSFYGIRTRSKNIIYVLDISGSMNADPQNKQQNAPAGERRIDLALSELLSSVASLPRDGTFNIIFYNDTIFLWKKKMQAATADAKEEARAWAKQVKAGGWTNIYDSVELAFKQAGRGTFDKKYDVGVETIFLLSDGSPNRGKFTKAGDMLREIKKLNELSKVEINAIGLGKSGGNPFLKRLAEENGGSFVLVE